MPKILVTGAQGNIGSALLKRLRRKHGKENIVAGGRRQPVDPSEEPFAFCDVTNSRQLDDVVTTHKITWLFHLAAMQRAGCDADPVQGMKVNIEGFQNVMEVARKHKLRVVFTSSNGAFGPSTPKANTPDVTIQRPLTLYGCSKVHNELIGEYYHHNHGVDFRCLRLPVVLSVESSNVSRSVVRFATGLLVDAVKQRHAVCEVSERTCIPCVYIEDCLDGLEQLMEVDSEKLTLRTYNMQGDSFTAGQLVDEIKKNLNDFTFEFRINEANQRVVDSTIDSVDDSKARKDWKWNPKYQLASIVTTMIDLLQKTQ